MMTVTIQVVDNGYVVIVRDCVGEAVSREVIEARGDTALDDVRAAAALLWRVLESIGHYGTKHDPARVRIRIEDQDGNEVA